jgi:hypothetical protein
VRPGLDRAQLRLALVEHDALDVERRAQREHVLAGFRDEDVGEEVAVADDDAERVPGHGAPYLRANTPN